MLSIVKINLLLKRITLFEIFGTYKLQSIYKSYLKVQAQPGFRNDEFKLIKLSNVLGCIVGFWFWKYHYLIQVQCASYKYIFGKNQTLTSGNLRHVP